MHKLYWLALIVFVTIGYSLTTRPVEAITGDVVISQIQINDSSGSRLIELYNNTSEPVDITNWCAYHSSATEKSSPDKLICFKSSDISIHLILRAQSYILIGSTQLGIDTDFAMTSGLGGVTGGHIYIVDAVGVERDRLGWGTASHPDGIAAAIINNPSHVLERKQLSQGVYQDTNDNQADFYNSSLRIYSDLGSEYRIGAIDEIVDICRNISDIQVLIPNDYYRDTNGNCTALIADICPNIDDIQIVLPLGYMVDNTGKCMADVCKNMDGLQQIIPDNMELDENSNCVAIADKCSNLTDLQTIIPDGFIRGDNNNCLLGLLPLRINELLPNATGSDDGNEFIEIFNPNESNVNLSNYIFYVGNNFEHAYHFPADSSIDSGKYAVFSNNDINFTLINTESNVQLFGLDNVLIDKTSSYDNPKNGMSWALIDNIWQYTNRPTPGMENVASHVDAINEVESVNGAIVPVSKLEPCAANQYRNPETNRCRLIATSTSSLMPCRDGQYRSEETNRCRSIVSDVADLMPCAEGQERNPDTNRCRSATSSVLGASDLKPCAAGQERNPETNRCRNVTSSIPAAAYTPEQTFEQSNNYMVWWSLAGVGIIAIIYGVWEWRQEIGHLIQKMGLFLHITK